jgi:hypothetical protein
VVAVGQAGDQALGGSALEPLEAARELQGGVDGRGAGRRQEHPAQVPRQQVDEPA